MCQIDLIGVAMMSDVLLSGYNYLLFVFYSKAILIIHTHSWTIIYHVQELGTGAWISSMQCLFFFFLQLWKTENVSHLVDFPGFPKSALFWSLYVWVLGPRHILSFFPRWWKGALIPDQTSLTSAWLSKHEILFFLSSTWTCLLKAFKCGSD